MDHGGCARRGCRQIAIAVTSPRAGAAPRPAAAPVPWVRRPAVLAALGALAAAAAWLALSASRPSGPPVTSVRLMTWAAPEEAAALEQALARFEQSHAGVAVRFDLTPLVAYEQKLIVLVAARDAPDVFALPAARLPLFAEQGALVDLSARWESARPSLRQAPWVARLDAFRVGGKLWGLPHPFSNAALVISAQSSHPDLAWELLQFLVEQFPPPAQPPPAPDILFPGLGPVGPQAP